jgi:acyl-CoA reductase-like NAD-dependent aldehyde dehydrogenase
MLRRMTPEERAEMRRHEKELSNEILAVKRAFSEKLNAMTFEERHTYLKQSAEKFRARGYRIV